MQFLYSPSALRRLATPGVIAAIALAGCGESGETTSLPDAAIIASECGDLAEGEGRCTDLRDFELCEDGDLVPSQCAAGTRCDLDSTSPEGIACDCDDEPDDLCPDPVCINDPDCAESPTERLVPAEIDGVASYAVTATALYVITARGGVKQLLRCPLSGCSPSPEVIDPAAGSVAAKLDVEVTSTGVFWIRGPKTIMQANLDGSDSSEAYELLFGEIHAPLRGIGAVLYFGYDETGTMVNGVARIRDGEAEGVPGVAGIRFSPVRIAAGGGWLAVWQESNPSSPQPIQLTPLAGGEVFTAGAAIDMPGDGVVVTSDSLFWIEREAESLTLKGCPIASCESDWRVLATDVGDSITSDGARLFYTRVEGESGVVLSCPAADAANGSCSPTSHASGPEWLGAHRLRVQAGSIYGINQRWESVYRAALAD